MSTEKSPADQRSARVDPDPLYDPAFLIFVYAAWAGATMIFGQRIGLMALVVGTIVHAALGLRQHRDPEVRPFVHDFGALLLFCSAAIAGGVLLAG